MLGWPAMRYLSTSFSQLVRRRPHHRTNVCHLALSITRSLTAIARNTSSDSHSMILDDWDHPIFSSNRVRERKSVFLAHASALSSTSELSNFIDHLSALPVLKKATHCMYAYRIIPDPVKSSSKIIGQHDGGERGSGERLSRLLDALECQNVVVVVSRWYGGVPLGSDRWKIISSVAKEALNNGNFVKQKRSSVTESSSEKNNRVKRKKK